MEEKIKEILNFWSSDANNGQMSVVTEDSYEDTAKEITSLITEFIEWMTKEEAFYGYLSEKYFLMTTENKKFSTIEELFQYWLDTKSVTTHDLQEIDKAEEDRLNRVTTTRNSGA